jgi:hypothetical protein
MGKVGGDRAVKQTEQISGDSGLDQRVTKKRVISPTIAYFMD